MATRYAVETVFKLIDQFTNPLNSVNREGKALGNMLKNDLHAAEKTLNAIPGKLLDMGKTAVKVGIGGVAAGMAIATKQFIEYDAAITAAGTRFQDLDVTSADYADQLAALGAEARRVAGMTPFSAVDTAGALDKMAQAGLTAGQSMKLLEGTTDLAIATGLDLTSAVDMATDAMGAFNLMKDEFGQPLDDTALAGSLQHLSDIVARTTNMANVDMNAWFEAVKMGAPQFTSLGGSVEDFSAMVGVLANAGIKGGEAGTALRNMMLNLSAPTDNAAMALEGLGVQIYDTATGDMLPFLDIMKQFETAFSGDSFMKIKEYNEALKKAKGDTSKVNISDYITDMNMGTKIQALETIFGKRTIGDFLVLLNEGSASIAEFSNQLANSEGAAKQMATAMQTSVQGQLRLLSSAASELGFKFVEAFKTRGVGGIQSLTDAISSFDPTNLINAALQIVDVITNIATGLFNMRGILLPLIAAFAIYKTIIYAVALGMGIYNGVMAVHQAITGIATGIQLAHNAALYGTSVAITGNTIAANAARVGMVAYSVAAKIWTGVQWLLNASLFGCPITWLVLGIIAAIGVIIGIIALIKNWGAVTEWFSGIVQSVVTGFNNVMASLTEWLADVWDKAVEVFDGIKNGFFAVIDNITAAVQPFFALFLSAFDAIAAGWQSVLSAFTAGGLIGALQQIGGAILSFILAPIGKVMAGLTWIPGIGGKIETWQNSIAGFRAQLTAETGAAQTAPITARDAQTINTERYVSTSETNTNVNIGLDRGLTAKISGGAPNVRVAAYSSGGF